MAQGSTVRLLCFFLIGAATVAAAARPPASVDFARDVQPIFRDHCVSCHGPEMQMNGLRLDRRAEVFDGSEVTGTTKKDSQNEERDEE